MFSASSTTGPPQRTAFSDTTSPGFAECPGTQGPLVGRRIRQFILIRGPEQIVRDVVVAGVGSRSGPFLGRRIVAGQGAAELGDDIVSECGAVGHSVERGRRRSG